MPDDLTKIVNECRVELAQIVPAYAVPGFRAPLHNTSPQTAILDVMRTRASEMQVAAYEQGSAWIGAATLPRVARAPEAPIRHLFKALTLSPTSD